MESTGNPVAYGLNYQSRCMTSRVAERDFHQFLVGTHSLKEKNEVHVIDYKEETERVECLGVYTHPGEIWQLQASSCKKDLFATAYTDAKGWQCSLWKFAAGMEGSGGVEDSQTLDNVLCLDKVCDLPGHVGPINTMRWSITEEGEESKGESLVTLDDKHIRWWPINQGTPELKNTVKSPEVSGLSAGCFDPHHDLAFIAAAESDISSWDFRSMGTKAQISISSAHRGRVLDLDYNPNRPYHIVSAGEDMVAKFWDLRKPNIALRQLGGHTHWIWRARFNRYHDQLLLTSGTDSTVNLWSIVSVSSAPVGELEGGSVEKEGDKLIKKYEGHRDSVYSVAWSSDAWVFASLSYEGTVIINNVPQSEKYKILL